TPWLHHLLCALYILGGGFCLGGPLRFYVGGTGGIAGSAVVAPPSRKSKCVDLARRNGVNRSQLRDSACVTGVLAAPGDLSDGDARPSNIRDRTTLQKYCGVFVAESGGSACVGNGYGVRDLGCWNRGIIVCLREIVAHGRTVDIIG